jgi:hypothetical protein
VTLGGERAVGTEHRSGEPLTDETVRGGVRMELVGKRVLVEVLRAVQHAAVEVAQLAVVRTPWRR